MQDDFQKWDFVQGLLDGIRACGEELARYFPKTAEDKNELSDRISQDNKKT